MIDQIKKSNLYTIVFSVYSGLWGRFEVRKVKVDTVGVLATLTLVENDVKKTLRKCVKVGTSQITYSFLQDQNFFFDEKSKKNLLEKYKNTSSEMIKSLTAAIYPKNGEYQIDYRSPFN